MLAQRLEPDGQCLAGERLRFQVPPLGIQGRREVVVALGSFGVFFPELVETECQGRAGERLGLTVFFLRIHAVRDLVVAQAGAPVVLAQPADTNLEKSALQTFRFHVLSDLHRRSGLVFKLSHPSECLAPLLGQSRNSS